MKNTPVAITGFAGVEIEDAAEATGDAENDGEAPFFSVQAVAGIPMASTMQIAVVLGIASLVALLDSGSTHNFISEEAARRSGLPLRQRPHLTALVANGERVTCAGVICDAPLLIDGDSFPADLYVMPLVGYDVVLDTRWLSELGPIVWDLGRRRMSFQHQGRPISWTGVDRPSVPTLGATTEVGPPSRTPSVCHPSERMTTALFSSLMPSRSPFVRTGTLRRTRMSWSGSVPP
jgi:hypothetical protein